MPLPRRQKYSSSPTIYKSKKPMKNSFRSDIHPSAMVMDNAGNICRVIGNGDDIGKVRVVYAENSPYEVFVNKNATELKAIPFSSREIAMMSLLAVDAFVIIKRINSEEDLLNGFTSVMQLKTECRTILEKLGNVQERVLSNGSKD